MRDEGRYRSWTVTENEHGKIPKRITRRTYCTLEWVMRTGIGAVTCVEPMALAPAPPILRTTWEALNFVTSQRQWKALSLSRIHSFGQEAAKGVFLKYQIPVPYILPSLDLAT
jgi:hypothetical protein